MPGCRVAMYGGLETRLKLNYIYDGTLGGLEGKLLTSAGFRKTKSSHGPPPDPGVDDFETPVVFFLHRRYRNIGADSTPLTVSGSRAFITVLLARSMTSK